MTTTSRLLVPALAAALVCGCAESERPTATGEGTIRGVNAIPDAPEVAFLIEERSLGTISFRETTSAQAFDDLTYKFNFDVILAGSTSPTRLATRELTVVPDTDYVFALTGSLDAPSIVLWEAPERTWNGSEAVLEAAAGHLAAGTGTVDVYLAPPGTAPSADQPRGTLAFGEKLDPFEIENGDWVLTLTPAGDPATILFRSGTQDLTERTSVMFTLLDPDPSLTSPLSVQRVTREGTNSNLADNRFPPTRRFFHAAHGTVNADVVVEGDFANPIVTNLAYGTLSADVAVPTGTPEFSYTQAGNPGAILLEDEDSVTGNTRSTVFLFGQGNELETLALSDNRRPVQGFARLRLTYLSSNVEDADLWLLAAGTDLADGIPMARGVNAGESSGYRTLRPGDYELSVTFGDDDTAAVDAVPVTLAAGDVVELAIIDTADPNVLDVVVYDP